MESRREKESKEKRRVLIVDDDPMNLDFLRDVLEDSYELNYAADGHVALQLAESFLPEIILTDIMMPNVDGYELCRRIRQNSLYDMTKILLVSGQSSIDERLKGYNVGADDYLARPFDVEELQAKLRVYLRLIKMEESLVNINASLENQVQIRTQQLLNSEKMAFLGMHTAELVHNMNNPLAILKAFCEELLEDDPKNENGLYMFSAIERIEQIVKGILLSTRKAGESRNEQVDLVEVIKSELELLNTQSAVRNTMKMELDLQPVPKLLGSNSHFSQILGNILKNAIEAMYKAQQRVLTVSTRYVEQQIIITVQDSGCGIGAASIKKIFDPFYTSKPISATHGEPTGTGLGLPSVKKMVKSYNGKIEVSSEPQQGTCFTITLPTNS